MSDSKKRKSPPPAAAGSTRGPVFGSVKAGAGSSITRIVSNSTSSSSAITTTTTKGDAPVFGSVTVGARSTVKQSTAAGLVTFTFDGKSMPENNNEGGSVVVGGVPLSELLDHARKMRQRSEGKKIIGYKVLYGDTVIRVPVGAAPLVLRGYKGKSSLTLYARSENYFSLPQFTMEARDMETDGLIINKIGEGVATHWFRPEALDGKTVSVQATPIYEGEEQEEEEEEKKKKKKAEEKKAT